MVTIKLNRPSYVALSDELAYRSKFESVYNKFQLNETEDADGEKVYSVSIAEDINIEILFRIAYACGYDARGIKESGKRFI